MADQRPSPTDDAGSKSPLSGGSHGKELARGDRPGKDSVREPQPAVIAELLSAASTGDQKAWRSLLEIYTPRVFGLIRSQCADAELAREITQSTFCTVAAKLGEYVELGRFESWIFRIAMNRLRDEMRRRKRHAAPMDSTTMSSIEVALPGRSADAPRSDPERVASKILAEAMASLGEADREVINLRHVGGLSFKQMAETLNEPLGTLLARHHRTLRKLREFLEARGFDADSLF
ncbi:MAG: sigma-70 family RNA polymerase sigma factor [Phycisphaerae bacterium]|nr:sigma-70 family RNA polymerase sigma factor [Phycisphaerae bacterium]